MAHSKEILKITAALNVLADYISSLTSGSQKQFCQEIGPLLLVSATKSQKAFRKELDKTVESRNPDLL